jgi:hypothetical protein
LLYSNPFSSVSSKLFVAPEEVAAFFVAAVLLFRAFAVSSFAGRSEAALGLTRQVIVKLVSPALRGEGGRTGAVMALAGGF